MEINRFWMHGNNAKILCQRPRVDYRITEYIFNIINENILIPKKIMLPKNYVFSLFMYMFIPPKHKIFDDLYSIKRPELEKDIIYYDSPYDTENTKYATYVHQPIGSYVSISCFSVLFNAEMTPREYVETVYNMFCFYFTFRYKKLLSKTIFDELKQNIDYDYINSFPFPAKFENQKYSLDNTIIEINTIYDKVQKKWIDEIEFDIKEEYLKIFE